MNPTAANAAGSRNVQSTVKDHNASKFFAVKDDDLLTKHFSREGCAQQIGDTVVVRYKPSAMELSVSCYAEWHHSSRRWRVRHLLVGP